jgi:hypothetical protein
MTTIKLLLGTALVIVIAGTAGRTLSSDPEWRALSGPDRTGSVDITFKSDYFPLG